MSVFFQYRAALDPREFGCQSHLHYITVQHQSPPSPHLFTLYTHDWSLRHQENSIVDHSTVIGRIIKQQ